MRQENFKKSCESMNNHEFRSPASTFQWCFYGGNCVGIVSGSQSDRAGPADTVTFTSLRKGITRYYTLFRLLKTSVVKV
jgi:hypothetical protein